MEKIEDTENRTVTGQWTDHCPVPRAAKTHHDYWKKRIKRRAFRDAHGVIVTPPEFSVRMFHLGREAWFNLETANQSAAAVKARDIYLSLVAGGWDPTLAKHKPSPMVRAEVCTVGQFLAEVGARSHLKAMTVRRYAVKMRKLVSDVTKLEAGLNDRVLGWRRIRSSTIGYPYPIDAALVQRSADSICGATKPGARSEERCLDFRLSGRKSRAYECDVSAAARRV